MRTTLIAVISFFAIGLGTQSLVQARSGDCSDHKQKGLAACETRCKGQKNEMVCSKSCKAEVEKKYRACMAEKH